MPMKALLDRAWCFSMTKGERLEAAKNALPQPKIPAFFSRFHLIIVALHGD
jgi:hypothetical protein